jgi:hypothetical protein
VRGNPVVDLVADPGLLQRARERVHGLVADHVQVPRRIAARGGLRQPHELAEPGPFVVRGGGAAAVAPGVEVRQLDPQDRGLQLVEARVVPDELERALVLGAVEAQQPDRRVELRVVRDDGAAVPERAEVLRREERERRDRPERARAAVRRERARRLGGVLDDRHAERLDLGDRRDVAEQVHGDHGLRARRQRGLDGLGGHAPRVRGDVAEDGRRTGVRDRLRGGVEREGGDDDLVARPDAERAQREHERVGPVGDAGGVAGAEVGGELLLEGLDLGPEDERAAVDHLGDLRVDRGAQRGERRLRVEQRDGHPDSLERAGLRKFPRAPSLGRT